MIIGIGAGVYSLTLDTSVEVSSKNAWEPATRVNNLGLMNQKQNYIIFSGVIAIVGTLMLVFGKDAPSGSEDITSRIYETTCSFCNSGTEIDEKEYLIKKFLCPECGKENEVKFVEIKQVEKS